MSKGLHLTYLICCGSVYATTVPNLDDNKKIQASTAPLLSSSITDQAGDDSNDRLILPTIVVGLLSSILVVAVLKTVLCFFHHWHRKSEGSTTTDTITLENTDYCAEEGNAYVCESIPDEKIVIKTEEIVYSVFFVKPISHISNTITMNSQERQPLPDIPETPSSIDDFCVISLDGDVVALSDDGNPEGYAIITLDDVPTSSAQIARAPVYDDRYCDISDKGICVLTQTHSYVRKYPNISKEQYCVISYNRSTPPPAEGAYDRLEGLQRSKNNGSTIKHKKTFTLNRAKRYVGGGKNKLTDYGRQASMKLYNGAKSVYKAAEDK